MTEAQKIIISSISLLILLVILIIISVLAKKSIKYCDFIIDEIEEKTLLYFQNITLRNGKYLECLSSHSSGVINKLSSKGDKDELLNISLKKHYDFRKDKLIYIVNGKIFKDYYLIDGKEFIEINNKIKSIEVFVAFDKPSHYLLRYDVIKNEGGYELKYQIKEVENNEN